MATPENRPDQGTTPLNSTSVNRRVQAEFVLAIDFGTTYTSITFAKRTGRKKPVPLTVENFPGDRCLGRNGTQVPTEGLASRTRRSKKRTLPNAALFHKFIYGYEIHRFFELPDFDKDRVIYEAPIHVQRMKLLLDRTGYGDEARKELRKVLDQLKTDGHIEDDQDVIRDLLTSYLNHCKHVLQMDHDFHERSSVEVVFCVPVCWSLQANAIMSNCVTAAMARAKFGITANSQAANLFMVNEAEAAATNALSSAFYDLKRREIFLLVDCGGGTTDLGLYRVAHAHPLRLETELSDPTGAAVGATDLNERMRQYALAQLESERYLCTPHGDATIPNIIENEIMPLFESEYKRAFNLSNPNQRFVFRIRGLRESATKSSIQRGAFVLTYIFEPSLRAIHTLVVDQIHRANSNSIEIDKVVLVGGYGDSPALKRLLKTKIEIMNHTLMTETRLITTPPNTGATGVATGAIMRALDKRFGPERVPRSSYGIMRHLEWDPDSDEDYMCQPAEKSEHDGEYEIRDTIEWLIKANEGPLASEHRATFESVHIFKPGQKDWDAEEILFVSETCTEDHYQLTHPKNEGKTRELGKIEFNLSHLKGCIPLSKPERGRRHYKVTVLIDMVVIDRDLKFFVRWPADEDGGILKGSEETFSMVAAFQPGTA
ncbi:hypothetical protein K458DRAFT_317433 [Lentithecium fluviatile CBS 122367]|uniref:Actin-like ATPase domain-containing protein n=1 Tax=Lentithecium fluviatile CBS 122367 TaxID=1168545 RepID=A0A6G1IJ43_9PLEO|nr:hypothetical protein K458DRAFT_317433 [Lentithecium fluviatile CBS 122367]